MDDDWVIIGIEGCFALLIGIVAIAIGAVVITILAAVFHTSFWAMVVIIAILALLFGWGGK